MRDGAKTKPDTRWLERRGHTWHVVCYTPRPLIPILGKRKLVASLKTTDLKVAQTRRHAALADFRKLFEQASRVRPGTPSTGDPDWLASARRWRASFERFAKGDATVFRTSLQPDPGETTEQHVLSVANIILDDEAEDIAERYGDEAAQAFAGIARGLATPLLFYVDAWLAEGGTKGRLNPRTAAQYRADLEDFEQWCKRAGVPTTIEAIAKPIVGRYITEAIVGKGIHWATGNRKISSCSSYWRWLCRRTAIDVNPWSGQSLSKGSAARNGEKSKRPFTDDEVRTLLSGNADPELADAMRVAALSGMRLEESYRLQVRDCTGGWFLINRSKTDAGVRRLPIHSALREIIERRCSNQKPDAYLFPEPGPAQKGRERSAALSKRFGRYRQRIGVHDRSEGRRHSRVDFHSWRRWFITQARNAGNDRAVVAAVVGHDAGNITDSVYHGGPSDELLRRCVESVLLP